MKDFLKETILNAGKISLDYKSRLKSLKITRKSRRDLVTDADVAVEKYIIDQIKTAYPSHSILGEESGTLEGDEHRWIIDPIDGTNSFVHGQPFYSVSIALEKSGQTMLAAVFVPVLNELFEAQLGKGATLNDEPISVSDESDLSESMLATGFACIRSSLENNNLKYFNRILPRIRGIRRCGSAAMDLSYVACGRFDGFWELNLNTYDIAAGFLIVTEAGGQNSDFHGNPTTDGKETLSTNGKIHDAMIQLLTQ